LFVRLPEPTTYDEIVRMISHLDTMFWFLVGYRTPPGEVHLITTDSQIIGDGQFPVYADAVLTPEGKRLQRMPPEGERMCVRHTTSNGADYFIDIALDAASQRLVYYMNLIFGIEMGEAKLNDAFVEILGCMENFDREINGSGRDPENARIFRSICDIVRQHGSSEEVKVVSSLGNLIRNELSLRQRLDRLCGAWKTDGFSGNPNNASIVKLRNAKPHGRGSEISPEQSRQMAVYLSFLTALFRFHIMKRLGFDPRAISAAYMRAPHRYGLFVPRAKKLSI
jgi:hypothetical protein